MVRLQTARYARATRDSAGVWGSWPAIPCARATRALMKGLVGRAQWGIASQLPQRRLASWQPAIVNVHQATCAVEGNLPVAQVSVKDMR
jgi:hypothetical protein